MYFESLEWFFTNIRFKDFVDLLLLYFMFYHILKFSERSGIFQVLIGLGVIALAFIVSEQLELISVHTILKNIFSNLFLVLVLIFQKEIRRGLTQLGSQNVFKDVESAQSAYVNEEIVKSLGALSKKGLGALIVFENKIDLSPYCETGVELMCDVKSEIIDAIFHPSSQIHDGAVIVRDGQIQTVGTFLPLSTNPALDKNLGTRHRAALGITEVTDCKVVVVSEESQKIAFIEEGRLNYVNDKSNILVELRTFLASKKRI